MQASWRHDGDKLTWIICTPLQNSSSTSPSPSDSKRTQVDAQTDDQPANMVGDVNLFIAEDDSFDPDDSDSDHVVPLVGELEIMIARKAFQRQGIARSALLTFMYYVLQNLAVIADEYSSSQGGAKTARRAMRLECFRVRIGSGNAGSIALFEGLGFRRVTERANYFGELELRRVIGHGLVEEIGRDGMFEMPRVLEYVSP